MKMTKKNYIGISLMVMYGIQLSMDISESKPLVERIIGSLLTLFFVYITANSLEDKDD